MKIRFVSALIKCAAGKVETTRKYSYCLVIACLYLPTVLSAQVPSDTTSKSLTLDQCIAYALENDFAVKQARLDEEIGEGQINVSLSAWLPQLSAGYNFAHNFKLPTSAFGDNLIRIGRKNTSNILFQANQIIYSNEVIFATRASRFARLQLDQNTEATEINTVVEVSKAFYDILLSNEQLRILLENISRQEKQYKDAYSRYEFGLVDKTDYQRASITLANSRSDYKRTKEGLKTKYAYLKQVMGYPLESDFRLAFDVSQMEQQLIADTMQLIDFQNRIEFQQVQSRQQLLHLNTVYYKLGFLPSVSAFINYNFVYLNNDLSKLYTKNYPTSQGGLQVALPIFQGTKRLQNIKIARLTEDRAAIDLANTRAMINTEYQNSLAAYKSNYFELLTLKQNVALSKEVYEIIKLQYDEGIKAYVDLVVAETALKASEINYYNAMYNLLASKLDLDRALGNIKVTQ